MKNFLRPICFLLFIILFSTCNTDKDKVKLTFAFGPDDSQTVQPLIDRFNERNPDIIVTWHKSSRLSDEFYRELMEDFKADQPTIDVFGADVVWTASLATNKYVEDLSKKFYSEFEVNDFLPEAFNSAVYQNAVVGVPWFTDAGIMYYRKDLLEEVGVKKAPATWEDLQKIARLVMDKHGLEYGYVFQGDNYEGGTATASEFIWNAGGDIMIGNLSVSGNFDETQIDPNIITIDSKASEEGWQTARNLITSGITPQEVYRFRELEVADVFRQGKAVFMRGWPGSYGSFSNEKSKIRSHQIGIAALPVAHAGMKSRSCLGGWNLMINANTSAKKKAAAWKFIAFLADAPQQKYRALTGGHLPSLVALYDDPDLLGKVAVISLAKDLIKNTRSRPLSPYYQEFSKQIAGTFNRVLKGEINPYTATAQLQSSMEAEMRKQTEGLSSSE